MIEDQGCSGLFDQEISNAINRLSPEMKISRDFQSMCFLEPLSKAARTGQQSLVRLLMSPKYHQPAFESDHRQEAVSAMNCAARGGNLEIVKLIIERSPWYTNKPGWATELLRIGACNFHLPVVEFVMSTGLVKLDEDGINPFRTPALRSAASNGHVHVVLFLLANGSTLASSGYGAMTLAVRGGYKRVVQALLDAGADIDGREYIYATKDSQTPLEAAAAVGQTDMVRFLLDNGANVNAPFGNQVVHCKGREARVETWTTGLRALTLAAEDGSIGVVRLLSERGISVVASSENEETMSPMFKAMAKEHQDVVALLLELGAEKIDSP